MKIKIFLIITFFTSTLYSQTPVYPVKDPISNLASSVGDVLWFPYTPIKKTGNTFEMYYTWGDLYCYATSSTGKDWVFRNFVVTPANETIIKNSSIWYMGYHTHYAGNVYFNTTQSSNGLIFPEGNRKFITGEDINFIINNDSFYCYIRPDAPAIDPQRKIGIMKSPDFNTWSPIQTILKVDSADYLNPLSPDFRKQFYSLNVFKINNDWWGLLNVYRVGDNGQDVEQGPPYSTDEHTVEVQLVYSDDGLNWKRTNNRSAFIPRGTNIKQMFGLPTVDNNMLYIYTIESKRRHTDPENESINGRWFEIWRYSMSVSDLDTWKPGTKLNLTLAIEGLLNSNGFHNISDTVTVEAHSSFAPYSVISSSSGIINSGTLTGTFSFPNLSTGNYYLSVKGKNFLETWSGSSVNIDQTLINNYNFTTSPDKAYGNNMKRKNGRYCFYSGDVVNNGMIELNDVITTLNDAGNFEAESGNTDLNGDGTVDLSDVSFVFNNANIFINIKTP